jgi:hypothetical protein
MIRTLNKYVKDNYRGAYLASWNYLSTKGFRADLPRLIREKNQRAKRLCSLISIGDENIAGYQELVTHIESGHQAFQKQIETLFFDWFSSKHLNNRSCKDRARRLLTKHKSFHVDRFLFSSDVVKNRCTLIQ